ncbi:MULTISPECIES: ABC transporter ATP-binding protein [unclassified Shewanella]|uniref:ABC transporter ATP-binding protein n=1 Tax=unclassified Shewanella TaxID=196818 RepID=UPI001BC41031|nr:MULTISPECIES: ABC transporter ATP-binding protein [unclassified Shewanella]GIU06738.1 ABC transporter [Shewanella sp. MBTL60-112-B1]GIU26413.1 ABC transporter [Shewanella sp. MBTL60-112-B2]
MSIEIVRLNRVSKGFNDGDKYHQVLDDINLTLNIADTVALTGPSGSGKSTLLNIIGGFEFIKQGQLLLNKHDTTNWQDKQWSQFRRQHLGVVFQQFNLLTPLNVRDNIAFSLRLNQQKWSPWCDYLLSQLGLDEVKNRNVETLSGGQQQRVAIARALAHKPQLLLADEPTGNLDEKAGHQVMSLLTQLAAESKTCVLMVTHSSDCAAFMKRRWHLEQGKIHE